jgi:hypothetical protein
MPGHFLVFSAPLPASRNLFSAMGIDLLQVEGTSQAALGLLTNGRYQPASLSLFLKSEKKSQLCFTEDKGHK